MSKLVQVNYIDETGKSFKLVPKRYKSSFNKLTLVSDEYKLYCEPIASFVGCERSDCDLDMMVEWVGQELRKSVFDKITNSTKVLFTAKQNSNSGEKVMGGKVYLH